MIEIRRINISTNVFLFSSQSAMQRQGHFETVLHITGYLKLRNNSRLMFDRSYSDKDYGNVWECD